MLREISEITSRIHTNMCILDRLFVVASKYDAMDYYTIASDITRAKEIANSLHDSDEIIHSSNFEKIWSAEKKLMETRKRGKKIFEQTFREEWKTFYNAAVKGDPNVLPILSTQRRKLDQLADFYLSIVSDDPKWKDHVPWVLFSDDKSIPQYQKERTQMCFFLETVERTQSDVSAYCARAYGYNPNLKTRESLLAQINHVAKESEKICFYEGMLHAKLMKAAVKNGTNENISRYYTLQRHIYDVHYQTQKTTELFQKIQPVPYEQSQRTRNDSPKTEVQENLRMNSSAGKRFRLISKD